MKQAILCVDDEAIIVLSLKQELKSSFGDRFRIESALSAEEALDALDELVAEGVKVIMIISDWLMPGIHGDEFLEIVNKKYPDVHAIMITGHADDAAVERTKKNASVIAILSKPWKAAELRQIIQNFCIDAFTK